MSQCNRNYVPPPRQTIPPDKKFLRRYISWDILCLRNFLSLAFHNCPLVLNLNLQFICLQFTTGKQEISHIVKLESELSFVNALIVIKKFCKNSQKHETQMSQSSWMLDFNYCHRASNAYRGCKQCHIFIDCLW